MAERPVDVLAIAGTGQNGATLASRLIGELPGVVAVGEVARIWDKGLVEDVACSCGAAFSQCEFWTKVGEVAFGGWHRVDGAEARRLVDSVMLRRSRWPNPCALPLVAFPRLSPRHARDVSAYAELTGRVLGATADVSGARIVLESSKWPAHVYVLGRSRRFHTRVLHLVRDPRGVAFSGSKRVPRQGARADLPYRPTRSAAKTASRWVWINASSHGLPWLGVPVRRVRYESLVGDPVRTLREISAFAQIQPGDDDLAFLGDGDADLPSGHLVAGNRMRLARGRVPMRIDEGWRSGLSARDRRLVTGLTWPLLRLYGYDGGNP